MMARSRNGSMDEAEDTTAVRPFVHVIRGQTNGHGAPRASRPYGRLRRCAPRSLDPCSHRGLSAAMRRRQAFVAACVEGKDEKTV